MDVPRKGREGRRRQRWMDSKDAVTSGFVSDLFTVYLDDKGQTILVICLHFTLSKKPNNAFLRFVKKMYKLGVY